MKSRDLETEFISLVVEGHSSLIYKICSLYANERYGINDLYQDILLNLWRGYQNFRGESKLATWIYQIALHTSISAQRKDTHSKSQIQLTPEIENMIKEEESKSAQLKEMYDLIRKLDKYNRALILLWLDDLSYQEIADILGITKTNVATKINRVKNKLKEMSDS